MKKSIKDIVSVYRAAYGFTYLRFVIELDKMGIHISLRTLQNWGSGVSKPQINTVKGYIKLAKKKWTKNFFQEIFDFLEFERINNKLKEKNTDE